MATEAFVKNNATVKVNVYKYFTSNTTFTVPGGVTSLTMAVTGAGGGGGGWSQYHIYHHGGGGGAGGYVKATAQVSPGQKLSIVVGKAGAGGGHSGEYGLEGGDGGTSSISGYITCYGGTRGYGYFGPSVKDPNTGRVTQVRGYYKAGKGAGCTYTSSKLSSINYVKGGDGLDGMYYDSDPSASKSAKGGVSAHGMNNRSNSPTYGAGGYAGTASYTTSYYNGRPGGAGLVQLWYKTDISNITF